MITRRAALGWLGAFGAALVGRKALASKAATTVDAAEYALPPTSAGLSVTEKHAAAMGPGYLTEADVRAILGEDRVNAYYRAEDYDPVLKRLRVYKEPGGSFASDDGAFDREWVSPWNGGMHYRSASLPPRPMRRLRPGDGRALEISIPVSDRNPTIDAVIAVYDQDRWYDWHRDGGSFVGRLWDGPLAKART